MDGQPSAPTRRNHFERVALADDAALKDVGKAEDLLDLVLDHSTHGDAGPVRDDAGDGVGIHTGKNQRGFALKLLELFLGLFQFRKEFIVFFGRKLDVG